MFRRHKTLRHFLARLFRSFYIQTSSALRNYQISGITIPSSWRVTNFAKLHKQSASRNKDQLLLIIFTGYLLLALPMYAVYPIEKQRYRKAQLVVDFLQSLFDWWRQPRRLTLPQRDINNVKKRSV